MPSQLKPHHTYRGAALHGRFACEVLMTQVCLSRNAAELKDRHMSAQTSTQRQKRHVCETVSAQLQASFSISEDRNVLVQLGG